MSIFSKLEGWSIRLFLSKAIRRAVPIGCSYLAAAAIRTNPAQFGTFTPDQIASVIAGLVWTGVTLAQNLVKFYYEKGA
jgi:hypothetical protein